MRRSFLDHWGGALIGLTLIAALIAAEAHGADKVQNHRDQRCKAGVAYLCDGETKPAPDLTMPKCEEDEIVQGRGDFANGLWSRYECEHPDNLSTEWHRVTP